MILFLALLVAAPSPAELDKACASGKAAACFAQAENYKFGRNVRRDLKRAAELYRRSCQLKDADGCAEDALGLVLGRGQYADPVPALARLDQLCKQDHQLACANLAGVSMAGFGSDQARARAPAMLSTACDRGVLSACRTLAADLADKKDFDGASKLADRACSSGDPEGCVLLGDLFNTSDDVLRAGLAYSKACSEGSSAGCYGQGVLLLKSGADRKGGTALLQKACKNGEGRACAALEDPFL